MYIVNNYIAVKFASISTSKHLFKLTTSDTLLFIWWHIFSLTFWFIFAPTQFRILSGCGQATITIPGTNITIPLSGSLGNMVAQQQPQQQHQPSTSVQTQQGNQQPQQASNAQQAQSQSSSNASAQSQQSAATQSSQNQQSSQQQAGQQQQANNSSQNATITIPGTNIQIPTSVAAANGLLSGANIKIEGGK